MHILGLVKRTLTQLVMLGMMSLSVSASAQQIDALILYSDGVEARYGQGTQSRINQIISVTNKVFSDSNLDLSIRAVHMHKISISDAIDSESVLDELTCDFTLLQTRGTCQRGEQFSQVSNLREQYGADVVIMYRPYQSSHGGVCGIAWIGGNQTNGNLSNPFWRETAMSVVSLDGPCADWVTSHELGHNMGLNHGALQDESGATYRWAWGYGESNNFATIMAYSFVYGNATRKAFNFSNPSLNCYGRPCGVNRTLSNGADASHALSITGPQVSAYTAEVISTAPEETTPTDNEALEALRQTWLNAQSVFNTLLDTYNTRSTERLSARTQFLSARDSYTNAFRDYAQKRDEFYRLTLVANRAIEAYNASADEDESSRASLLTIVNQHIANRETATEQATAALSLLNSVTPTYQQAFGQHDTALSILIEARNAMLTQRDVMNEARRIYDEALSAS